MTATVAPSDGANGKLIRKEGKSATYSLINFMCGMIGPGCFALATSFKEAGVWGGLVLVFVVGFLSLFSMQKIVRCSQFLAERYGHACLDYGEMAETAMKNSYPWAKKYASASKIVVNGSLLAFQIGVITVFLVFATDHIIEIYEFFAHKPPPFSKTVMLCFFFIAQLALNIVGNYTMVTSQSTAGNIVILAAIILITKDLMQHSWYHVSELKAVSGIEGLSLAAGALIYSFEGQAMVMPLENSLKHPSDMNGFTGVLATAMNLVTLLYAFMGFFGYVTFGPAVQGSLTLNLPNSIFTVTIKILLVLKIFFGSTIQLYVIVEMLKRPVQSRISDEKPVLKRLAPYFLRVAFMLLALCLAIVVPNLMQIIPLVGITAGLLISLILPSFFDTMVFLPSFTKDEKLKYYRKLIINMFLFLLGWVFMATGLYSSIDEIRKNSS